MVDAFVLAGTVVLLLMSGLFSGLTLGLLGLDPVSLEIVSKGDTANAKNAQDVIPIRAKGNFLLCSLLLGNVAVNSLLSILLAQFAGGIVGFILSSSFIVIFGEIVPQASCSRHALYLGSKVICLVQGLLFVMAPLAWPISKVLDWLVGDEIGLVYTNRELRNLVELHTTEGNLTSVSAGIMQGALNFSKLTIKSVMTEWKSVFYLQSDAKLDFETLERIFKSGHSRVPVVEVTGSHYKGQRLSVIGILFVKDLILLDPEDELPVRNIIDTFLHDVKHVDHNTGVKSVMEEFRHGRSHLAIVSKQSHAENGDVAFENVGIVTLEDIIENILNMDIEDEFDQFNRKSLDDGGRKDELLQLFDYRRTRGMEGMPPQEKIVVYRHFCKEVKVFRPEFRKADVIGLQNLLASGSVYKVVRNDWNDYNELKDNGKKNIMIEKNGYLLYSRGVATEYFTFILDGKAEAFTGRQKFRSEVSKFTILCPELLWQTQNDLVKGLEFSAFVPDFTCRIIQNSRILRISRENFHKCLLGKLKNYSRPLKETREKIRDIIRRPSYLNSKSILDRSLSCGQTSYNGFSGNTIPRNKDLPRSKYLSMKSCPQRHSPSQGDLPTVGQNGRNRKVNPNEIAVTERSRSSTPPVPKENSAFLNIMVSPISSITFDPDMDDAMLTPNDNQPHEAEAQSVEQIAALKDVSETSPLIAYNK